jgi:nucleotide-binding universal stress UspA family protein
MSEYRRVLIPIDLTPGIQMLAPAVRRLIDIGDAEITLLHVVDAEPRRGRAGHTLRLMTELELFAHRQFRGVRISRRIEWGRPADCILNAIRTDSPDAVLLTGGRSSPGADALGPIAREVLAEASCPVLLEWAVSAPVNGVRTQPVCCALILDGSDESVLTEAVWAAARIGAPLKLVHALVPGGPNAAMPWDPQVRDRETAIARSRMAKLRDRYAPGAEVQVDVGMAAAVINRAIRFHRAGLLVTGGSRETLVAAESACPVLYLGHVRRSRAGRPVAVGQTGLAAWRCA